MYVSFFNLREQPFSLTPDPRFLFLGPQHEEALSHLLYGIRERKGFIEVTGEVGTGKTILCRALLNRLDTTVSTALIFNAYLTEIELLQAIISDFGLTCEATTRKGYIDVLNRYLLEEFAAGRNAVVLVDEAQNLEPRVLEQLRMLSNLETERGKLLQIVLVGQPELRDRLATPQMRQLDQRIAVRFHLQGLTRSQTRQYIIHRMSVAGAANTVTFTRRAVSAIYRQCAGIPRRINLLCDRALVAAYVRGKRRITARIIHQSLRDMEGFRQSFPPSQLQLRPLLVGLTLGGLAGLGALSLLGGFLLLPAVREQLRPLIPVQVLALTRPASLPAPLPQPVHTAPPLPAEPPPAPSAPRLPEAHVALAHTLWRLKPQAEASLPRLQSLPLGSWHTLSPAVDNEGSVAIMPMQVSFAQLARLSRPCFIEMMPQAMSAQLPALWVLAAAGDDHVLIYQEPEGLTRMSLQQLQQRWYGKLYLTLKEGTYRGAVLKQGMEGASVHMLQRILQELGYFSGALSGHFNAQTLQAVKGFQRDNQLVVDGQVGRQTLMMLLHFGSHAHEETT